LFNLDEVGISDWEDRKTKRVIVSDSMLGQMIYLEVSRNMTHISMIMCVSAAGESLLPYIETSMSSSIVQKRLRKQGVRLGRDFALQFDQKPYINAGIFLDYIRTVFLPYINPLRGLSVVAQELTFSLRQRCVS
jgi:hypothetical protein